MQQSDYAAGSAGVYRGEETAGDPLCPGERGEENRREDYRTGNGKRELRGVTVEKREGGEKETVACDGLFVAIGLIPENEAFRELAALNSYGYFDSDEACTTKTPGVFVAGDCRSKNVRQLTTAAGDGATAALAACRFIDGQG